MKSIPDTDLLNDKKLIFFSHYGGISNVHLYKEPGEITYYFTKLFNYRGIIDDYRGDSDLTQKMFRTVELQSYNHLSLFVKLRKIFKIFRLAKQIDILYLISIYPETLYKMLAYRIGGGKGKIYVKLDLSSFGYMYGGRDMLVWKNMPFYLKIAHYIFKRLPTVYTVETLPVYNRLKKTYYGNLIDENKLFLMPNGFDPKILDEYNIIRKSIPEKERIIITVGRIGTHQKNTELLLKILSKVNLRDWKVYIIGPQMDSFKNKITDFYTKNPGKVASVFFTGSVSQKELYEYYNRSRIFLLTSREESFGFVLLEAAYMGNYIISTDVGCVAEILNGTNGYSVSPEDSNVCQKMSEELERIINQSDDELNSLSQSKKINEWTWESILSNNIGIKKLLQPDR